MKTCIDKTFLKFKGAPQSTPSKKIYRSFILGLTN